MNPSRKPMLAEVYSPERIKGRGTVYSQPKLNGVRCLATREGLWSRTGLPIETAPHINEILEELFMWSPDVILDGELYRHGLSFPETLSAFQTGNVPLCFCVFDWTRTGANVMPFGERSEKLSKVMERYRCDDLWIVPTTPCRRRSDLDAAYEGYLAAEFEGQVIRLDLPYHHGRTRAMLKRKPGEGA